MADANQFESNVDSYMNQAEVYKQQLNEYKNQIIDAKNSNKDLAVQLGMSALPVVIQGIGLGVSKVAGSAAGQTFSKIATPDAIQAAIKGDASLIINNMKALKTAKIASGAAEDEEAVSNPVVDLISSLKSSKSLADVGDAISSTIKGSLGAVEGQGASIADVASGAISKAAGLAGGDAGGLQGLVASGLSKLSSVAKSVLPDGIPTSTEELTQAATSALSKAGAPESLIESLTSQGVKLAGAGINDLLPSGAGAFVSLTGEAPAAAATEAIAGISEPVSTIAATTTNQIARAFAMAKQLTQAPNPLESLPSVNEIANPLADVAETTASELPQTLIQSVTSIGSQIASKVTSAMPNLPSLSGAPADLAVPTAEDAAAALSGLGSNSAEMAASAIAGGVAKGAQALKAVVPAAEAAESGESLATIAGTTAAEAEAAGAEGGPVGLVIGALVTVGTILGSIFGHHNSQPVAPVAVMPTSIPTYQPGLNTGS